MKIGTKSVLFGAHQFMIHPWFVAYAWWKLYGFPFDPRLWVAFFVHDLGYIGKPNMDGPEGESHPEFGARIMSVFDHGQGRRPEDHPFHASWYCFCFFHSRFLAGAWCKLPSRLCMADKLAIALEPWWLYLPRVILSGEINEYMGLCKTKYKGEVEVPKTRKGWFLDVKKFCEEWAYDHRNIKPGTLRPQAAKEA